MNITPLCKIAFRYGTDKCPQIGHHYTPFYYKLLRNRRKTVKKVLEIGIGSRVTMPGVPDHYQTGASLLMWRDFFPNAQIYGVDIDPSTIFQSERITTFLLDTRESSSLSKLIGDIGSDIDLVIDDGSHNGRSQIQVVSTLMPILKKNCIYVIEDARQPFAIRDWLRRSYACQAFVFPRAGDALVVVKKR
ncbi:hypothetical protein A2975_00170 [Candidatus Woesebacteria bacterium RIFCSPLOWO2_01_FULL_44_14]|uniref:Rhamnosyl O-methyltransferase n=1 Tax=Candidatus Woesebacteria bacterium RIFCSPLOWO2_01_FULL_44_14 TaxID=1802525 RepID=A0A1F8C4L9_9BACT|nr:MAG: hypothetical protein A2975_00170 [Candidatus Woesebacteria bacterium RIFCSPLOWO2_01_FULL_44_14]